MRATAHNGIAQAIRPVHTPYDGDTVLAVSTGDGPTWTVDAQLSQLSAVHAAAADTLGRAVVHAMLSAEPVGDYRSYCDTYPSARPGS